MMPVFSKDESCRGLAPVKRKYIRLRKRMKQNATRQIAILQDRPDIYLPPFPGSRRRAHHSGRRMRTGLRGALSVIPVVNEAPQRLGKTTGRGVMLVEITRKEVVIHDSCIRFRDKAQREACQCWSMARRFILMPH